MTDPNWLPTAKALAAAWTGPPLVQYTVSEGAAVCKCPECFKVLSEEQAEGDWCPYCGAGEYEPWVIFPDYPDADTVPDFGSSPAGLSNVGALLEALPFGWTVTRAARGGFKAWKDSSIPPLYGETSAHVLALALLETKR